MRSRLHAALSKLRKLTDILESSYSTRVSEIKMWNFSTMRICLEQELLSMSLSTKSGFDNDFTIINDTTDAIIECYRLGAMVYMNLVLRCIPPSSSIHRLLSGRIMSCVDSMHDKKIVEQSGLLKTIFWAIMLGGAVATEISVIRKLESIVRGLASRLRISSWIDCRRVMQDIVYSSRGCEDLCSSFYLRSTMS
jgi:hypothetical protein